ncbi:glycosyl transferase family protein [Altererythrobacter sp. Root672]|uniref:glycosyl transferase family protein n=1 Tax=Altererythrobacter sp. Root672 TaxID=1736584 RepID=UPI001F2D71C6|nr:glycosyl transferase family protein [Altererythrobacter sp. Root672]
MFDWFTLVERELLLFAGVFLLLGSLDELAVDIGWAWLRLTGRAKSPRIERRELSHKELTGSAALFIPAWREARVIGITLAHALAAWPQSALRVYVGCYSNDASTIEAVMRGSRGDPRLRLVVHDQAGPTTKADCLNRLYAALEADERRSGERFRQILLHDAEDMVDPAELVLIDRAVEDADFVQLPVLPEVRPGRWIGNHYCDEFAEAHGKAMVVRQAVGAALPGAGVGCGFARPMLAKIDALGGGKGPFPVESLTEDYELGMTIKAAGGRSRFLRVRGEDGQLVATRAYFPARIDQAVRQKARWLNGIALQGWDRLGWSGGVGERWMRVRDRRGPLSALALFAGYALLVVAGLLWSLGAVDFERHPEPDPLVTVLLAANFVGLVWRVGMRFAFTAREYGWREGLRAILRIPLANLIAIMAARRAVGAYARWLLGRASAWDKTDHDEHPGSIGALQNVRANLG